MLVNMHEAKTQLSRLVERAANGEDIVIGKAGRPVARLVPYEERKEPRRPGSMKGKIWMADDWDETPQWFIDAIEGNGEFEDELLGK
jgi:prevent-host-death family protein